MPEFLRSAFASDAQVDLLSAGLRMLGALFFGLAVAWLHARAKARRGREAQTALSATLVLLTVLLCLTTIVVGDNIARAFSIVGALSIVRFRTVVEDTRDTAFVIFAVVLGLALGAGYVWLPLLALPVGAVASQCFESSTQQLTLRAGLDFQRWDELEAAIAATSLRYSRVGMGSRRGGTEQERHYELLLKPNADADALLKALTRVEGLQAADLRRV